MTSPILVIGATGKVGSRIVSRLEALGQPVRGASRKSSPSFDWEDQSTWAATLAGAETAFVAFVPDLAAKGAPEAIRKFTEIAKETGLKRLVLLSGRGEHNAQASEAIVQASGLDYTIVRASWFNQNFSEGVLLGSLLEGYVALPAHDRKEPFIDVDDIADVATAALIDERHNGQLYEVTGPRLLSFADAVAEINAASGLSAQYSHISLEEFHAALLPEVGAPTADFLHDLCAEVFDGRNESIGNGVQRALGREQRDFGDFVKRIAATGVWSAQA
ncbi:SDR family oxidoreductase [Devosia lacusdianchii]|uniref:SDR family oxidoreductase n=1 Tax=Devosia lacusdianchii TaxID=2917991 RepID=UPI001F06F029|nr:NAD(P)H-binding protein [Devosia sp. JXJ CY 41]